MKEPLKITGAEAILSSLIKENVDTIFGDPGGTIIPLYDTEKLYDILNPFGILQFVRSGRISISKQKKELSAYLNELPLNEYVKE